MLHSLVHFYSQPASRGILAVLFLIFSCVVLLAISAFVVELIGRADDRRKSREDINDD